MDEANIAGRGRVGIPYSLIAKTISFCPTTNKLALENSLLLERTLTGGGGGGEARMCSEKASEVPICAQAHFWSAVEDFYVIRSDTVALLCFSTPSSR